MTMPSRTDESPRAQHVRDRQPAAGDPAESRQYWTRGQQITTPHRSPHAGFDADLNPIDDELINTHGSEK
jgi:hypothetical protein